MKENRFVRWLLPEEYRTFFALLYFIVSGFNIVFSMIAYMKHVYGLDASVYTTVAMIVVLVASVIGLVRSWGRATHRWKTLVGVSHFLMLLAFSLLFFVQVLRDRPLVKIIAWIGMIAIILAVMILVSRIALSLMSRAQARMTSLLEERPTLSRRLFLGAGTQWLLIGMMSTKRKIAFFIGGVTGVLVWLYLMAVLVGNGMIVPAVVATAGLLVVDVLYENIMFLELAERKGVESELRAARNLQISLFPKEDPHIPGLDIAGICRPANEVSGDFYDYVWLNRRKTRLGIAVADVSGKAMKAAMTAVLTSGMLYSEVEKNSSPKEVLRRVNHPLYIRSDRRSFTALSFAAIDIDLKVLTHSSAGQISPVLVRRGKAEEIHSPGLRLPLGIVDHIDYRETRKQLRDGDTLVLVTDGIVEAMNERKEMYGFERLMRDLQQWGEGSPVEIRDRLLREVEEYEGRAQQHDDMTIVVVKVGEK